MTIDAVVFIPGICGSVLQQGGRTIWPGTPANKVLSSYPDEFVDILGTNEDVTAPDVLRSVPLSVLGRTVHHFGVYGDALKILETMGFKEAAGTLVPFAYDWRRDVRTSASTLAARLSQPDLRGRTVAIVAHSMGGLVARYALERLGIPEGVQIDLLALLATPHLGAPAALQNIVGLRPEIFLSAVQCRVALGNPAFPSGYQLLPRRGVPALLTPDPGIGFRILDPFDPVQAAQLGLVGGSLDAARTLGDELPFMGPGFIPPCPYLAISGNAQKTIVSTYRIGSNLVVVEQEASGDGTVPLWSSAPPGIPVRYVSATHLDVCTNADTSAALRAVLTPRAPGGRLLTNDPRPASLSLEPLRSSVSPGETFSAAIVLSRPDTQVAAQVVVTRVFDGDRSDEQTVPVAYQGGPLRSLPLEFTAPDERAVMTFVLQDRSGRPLGKEVSVLVVP